MRTYCSKCHHPQQVVQIHKKGWEKRWGRGSEGCTSLSNSAQWGTFASSPTAEKQLHSSLLYLHFPIASALLHVMLTHIPWYQSLASENFCQQYKTRLTQSSGKPRMETSEQVWSRLYSNKCTISK